MAFASYKDNLGLVSLADSATNKTSNQQGRQLIPLGLPATAAALPIFTVGTGDHFHDSWFTTAVNRYYWHPESDPNS